MYPEISDGEIDFSNLARGMLWTNEKDKTSEYITCAYQCVTEFGMLIVNNKANARTFA
ncbi:17346_t:CDS:2, partial [Entrophospora sp. SA101]